MEHQDSKFSFEQFIIQCCKSREWHLRKWLKKNLLAAGFTIQEDSYRSSRTDKNPRYGVVHNLLAIRGNPRVCLVAHTDCCRDHSWRGECIPPDVFPVLKNMGTEDKPRMIIQDKECNVQTGGDDRLGVAINTWIALNTGYDMALLFTTDEEIGLCSAGRVAFPELNEMEILVQVDRGNHSNQLVNQIGGVQLCSPRVAQRLLKIAEDGGQKRSLVNGLPTDVMSIRRNMKCRQACNMTCGYHNSVGSDAEEYIDVEEARETKKFVSNIIQYYDLLKDLDEPEKENKKEENEEEEIDWSLLEEGEIDIGSFIQLQKWKSKNYKSVGKNRRKYVYTGGTEFN